MKRMVVFLAVAALAGCAGAGISDVDRPMVTSDCVELAAAGPDGMIPAMLPAAGAGQGIGVALNIVLPREDQYWEDSGVGFDVYYAMELTNNIGLRLGLGFMNFDVDGSDAAVNSYPISAKLTYSIEKGPGRAYALAGMGLYLNDEKDFGNVKVDASLGTEFGLGYALTLNGGKLSVYGEGKLLLMDADVSNAGTDELLFDAIIFTAGMKISF